MGKIITPGQTNGHASQPQLVLQKIYLKDVSFETPHAPKIFQDMGASDSVQPQVQLNLGHAVTTLEEDIYEVVLSLTLNCTLGDRTAYLAEVKQAGIFTVSGFPEAEHDSILGSYCPQLLFPYARQVISSLVSDGGFPPFFLQPINFDALYAEKQRQEAVGDEAPTLNS